MTEVFKFFNSAPGDERWHYASDFADYFGSVLSSGLISNGNEPVGLQVTVNSGTLTTNVAIGKAIIKGYSYENTQPITLTHGIPEQTMDRIDRVVLRLDLRNSARFIKVFVKEGVSATTPNPPTLQRDTNVYELSLAKVTVRKNSASIVASDIVDERANEELCGIVQSLITVPTSVFQQQFTAWFNDVSGDMEQEVSDWQATQQQAFNDWFATIQGALDGDIGANLANQIATHKLDNAKHGVVGVATGTNTLVMTNSDVTAYTDMMLVAFKNTTESTGATTLNINGLGAKAIVKANGGAVTNLKANAVYQVRYNGTSFILLGEGGGDVVKKVQRGTVDLYNSKSISISAINASNSIVLVSTYGSNVNSPTHVFVKGSISSSTSILLERGANDTSANTGVQVFWQVIEFESGVKKIQSGSVRLVSEAQSLVSISEVNLSKSFVISSFKTAYTSPHTAYSSVSSSLLDSTHVYIRQFYVTGTLPVDVYWYVVEFE